MILNEIAGVVDSVNASVQDSDIQVVHVVADDTKQMMHVEASTLIAHALGLVPGHRVVLTIPGEAIGIGDRTSRINWGDLAEGQTTIALTHTDPLGSRWAVKVTAIDADPVTLRDYLKYSQLLLSAVPISDNEYNLNHQQAQPFDTIKDDDNIVDQLKPQIYLTVKVAEPALQGPARVHFQAFTFTPAPEIHPQTLLATKKTLVVSYDYEASDTSDSDVDIGYEVSGSAIDLYLGSSVSNNLPHRGPLSGTKTKLIDPPFSVPMGSTGKVTAQARAGTKWYRLTLDINVKW